jgi:hypothetical protein
MIISVFYSLLVTKIIMPYFIFQSFGSPGGYAFNPDTSRPISDYLIQFFNNPLKRETILVSILSFGLLPLLSPVGIILMLQDWAQRFVLLHVGNPFRWGLNLHYNINLAVLLFYSSLLSVSWLQKKSWYKKILPLHALIIAGLIIYFHQFRYHGPFGLLYNPEFYRITKKWILWMILLTKFPEKGRSWCPIILPSDLPTMIIIFWPRKNTSKKSGRMLL